MNSKITNHTGTETTGPDAKANGEKSGKDTLSSVEIPHGSDLENPPPPVPQKLAGFADEVFNKLPDLLKNACSVLKEQTEKEVFLIGALAVISGLLPNVRGFYDSRYYGCNLYVYLLGAYGTGKGVLQLSYRLAKAVHNNRIELSKLMQAKYKQDCIEAKLNNQPEPEKPGNKMLFIPANISKSGFVELLSDNEGAGILFETEGDTLADALKTDYGGFSDVLRKAFHHEKVSFYRRTGSEFREIETPHLSVLLSSTVDQYQKLIPTIQNGLFSRFLHYHLTPSRDFKNVFDSSKRNYPEYFDELGETFFNIHSCLETLSNPIEIKMLEHQERRFLDVFDEWKKEMSDMLSTDLDGTVNRLGLICFRLVMIFTALRNIGEGDYSPTMICMDIDFENSLRIVEILKCHSLKVYYDLPQPKISKEAVDFQNILVEKAEKFTLCKALWKEGSKPLDIAKRTGIPKSTVYRYLNGLKR